MINLFKFIKNLVKHMVKSIAFLGNVEWWNDKQPTTWFQLGYWTRVIQLGRMHYQMVKMWGQDIKHTINISSSMKICDVGVLVPIFVKLSKLRPYSLRDILHIFKEFEYVIIWSPKTLLHLLATYLSLYNGFCSTNLGTIM
jgi:hypothetical protein